ncbi:hypothetical protein LUZ60_017445 [Juncus effusus]|nr:hypothetical protein LUZ60_017445 [Juncus effusus]
MQREKQFNNLDNQIQKRIASKFPIHNSLTLSSILHNLERKRCAQIIKPNFFFLLMEEETLEKFLDLLGSLLSSCHSVHFFQLKWQLIRDKLEELSSILHNSSYTTNSFLSPFVQSLFPTLNQIQLVEVECSDESYNGGRLLLKSNLDKIISNLDFHIEKLTEICSSSVNSVQSQAIVPAKPVIGTVDLDYVKFYINDIFSRLRIGSLDVQARTLSTLGEFLNENERYVKFWMQEIENGIGFLVNFLENEDTEVKEEAMRVVLVISQFDSYREALVKTGVIAPLVQFLERGNKLQKENSVFILSRLTENSDNVWSFSAHGGVSAIINNCRDLDGIISSEMICSGCVILKNLMRIEEIKRFIIDEGAILVLISLLKLREIHEICKIQLVDLLNEMGSNDDEIKQKMASELGFFETIIQLLDPNTPFSWKAREVSLRAIESFAQNIPPNFGFINWIILYLNHEESIIQELALKIISKLSKISDEFKISIGKLGAITSLIKLLDSKSSEIREISCRTIFNLVSVNMNRQIFLQDENNVKELMRLLDPSEGKSVFMKYILSIVMILAESRNGRRKIINCGYICNLEKLEELGVLDAKRIMKKLFVSRLQNIVSKIWSM